MNGFLTRAYNEITIIANGRLVKSSTNAKLLDEMAYYDAIEKTDLAYYFPRQLPAPEIPDMYSMCLEYYPYPSLGEYVTHDIPSPWTQVVVYLLGSVDQFRSIVSKAPPYPGHIIEMYVKKTMREMEALVATRPDLQPILLSPEINGQLGFDRIWPDVSEYIHENMLNYTPSVIHGDLCFNNILWSPEGIIRFIDPRGSFGAKGIYGDIRYDVAKLYHSIHGRYEFLISDKFDIVDNKVVFPQSNAIDEIQSKFDEMFFPHWSRKEIALIAGTIFIGMAARHYDGPKRQHAMYLIGVDLLNQAMEM